MRGWLSSHLWIAFVLLGATHASAQVAPTPPSTNPADQAKLRAELRSQIDYSFNQGKAGQENGDCVQLRFRIDLLREQFGDEQVRLSARPYNVYLPPAQRREISRYAASRLSALLLLDCPPKTAVQPSGAAAQPAQASGGQATQTTTPQTTQPLPQTWQFPPEQFDRIRQILEQSPVGPYLQFGAGGTFWDDIQVGNGNFNTGLNATGPKFDATLSVPIPGGLVPNSTFEARFYGFRGSGSQELSGNAGIFNQANGGVQVINLPITSGETRVEMTQVGGEARLKFKVLDSAAPTPAQRFFFSYTPFVGAGFERTTLDTQTLIDIVPFNFRTSDARTTVTDTIFISGGLQVDTPPVFPGGPVVFVFGSGRINFDSVTGMTVYDTQGIGFHEILHNQFSRNVVTLGGEAGIGVLQELPNSAFLKFVASVASQRLHEIVFHPGQPATLEDRQHLRAELAAMLVVPFIPFTP